MFLKLILQQTNPILTGSSNLHTAGCKHSKSNKDSVAKIHILNQFKTINAFEIAVSRNSSESLIIANVNA